MRFSFQYPAAWRCSALQRLILILLLCLLLPPLQAAGASPPSAEGTGNQVLRSQVRELLIKSDADPEYARQAALLLEKHAPPTFQTADYPLLLAEAWYRSANPDADIKQTYPIFKRVRRYAEKALALDPGRTEALYWLSLAKLRKAQKVGGIRAFFIVWSAIDELQEVRRKCPTYDQGGAARVLSLLYRVAPQWTPFGNMEKAVRYGLDAVRICGDYPLNRLYLARAYLRVDKTKAAVRELRKIMAMPPNPFAAEARKQLVALGKSVF